MRRKMLKVIMLGAVCLSLACQHLEYTLNQDKAESSMKAIRAAQATFRAQRGNGGYGTLEELAANKLIDPAIASGIKDGYKFKVEVSGTSFKATAVPLKYKETGSWSFYLDESGIIRGNVKEGAEATVNDPPLRYQ